MNDLFLRACSGEPVERTPVWFMRQAGRCLPEYREVRQKHDFWTLCRTPELAALVTLQPIDRLDVDAAILFSDILVGFPAMGCDLEFLPAPSIRNPVRNRDDVAKLKIPDPETDLPFVLEAIRVLRHELEGRVPLIGFGGAPFTLAAYMVEGGGGKGKFHHVRSLLHQDPGAARDLLDHLTRAQERFLGAQIDAGAQAIQIFDTWGGILPRDQYREFALEPLCRLVEGLRRPNIPLIYYLRDGAHVLDLVSAAGVDVLSIDEKIPLSRAAELVGPGHLDPHILLGSQDAILRGVTQVLEDAPRDRGHVFNLGHGILPDTPLENTLFLVGAAKRLGRRGSR
jgi:uroporphyrinogen decarboxylase